MTRVYDASPTEALGTASDFIEELAAEGMTQGDILNVFTTAVVTWAGDFERLGTKGVLPSNVRTQHEAIREVGRIMFKLADTYERRHKRQRGLAKG